MTSEGIFIDDIFVIYEIIIDIENSRKGTKNK